MWNDYIGIRSIVFSKFAFILPKKKYSPFNSICNGN